MICEKRTSLFAQFASSFNLWKLCFLLSLASSPKFGRTMCTLSNYIMMIFIICIKFMHPCPRDWVSFIEPVFNAKTNHSSEGIRPLFLLSESSFRVWRASLFSWNVHRSPYLQVCNSLSCARYADNTRKRTTTYTNETMFRVFLAF